MEKLGYSLVTGTTSCQCLELQYGMCMPKQMRLISSRRFKYSLGALCCAKEVMHQFALQIFCVCGLKTR